MISVQPSRLITRKIAVHAMPTLSKLIVPGVSCEIGNSRREQAERGREKKREIEVTGKNKEVKRERERR